MKNFLLLLLLLFCISFLSVSQDNPQLTVPNYPITALAISGDGKWIAVAGRSAQISENEHHYFIDILDGL